jgi:chitin disaccharide deacetylase
MPLKRKLENCNYQINKAINLLKIIHIYMKTKKLLIFITCLMVPFSLSSQQNKNLAELLGYPKDSKLLIIHADDMGLAQSVNEATLRAFDNKGITSGSIMMPCPWAFEMATYLKENPGLDVGIHLTLTAEWDLYRWGGTLPSDKIPSLLDKDGFLYPTVEAVGKYALSKEAEMEMKSQINKAIALGVNPTHIDTHMGSVLANPELVKIYLGLSEQYHLPILFPRIYLSWLQPDMAKELGSKIFLLDNLFMLEPQMIKGKWIDAYKKGIEEMKPGLNQMIVHVALDNDEMRSITKGHPDYGSVWRQKDLDLLLTSEFKELIKKNEIILINWGQIRDLMNASDSK